MLMVMHYDQCDQPQVSYIIVSPSILTMTPLIFVWLFLLTLDTKYMQ